MMFSIRQFLFIVLILLVTLGTVACQSRTAQEDIAPVTPADAQAVPEELPSTPTIALTRVMVTPTITLTNEISVAATVTLTPTLRTEIVEPESVEAPLVSPVVPTKRSEMPASERASLPPDSQAALAAAVSELADQTGLPKTEIKVVSVEAIDWTDTSLGCPKEGFMYAQVITPGYQIILEAAGKQYDYRTDKQASNVVLCEP